MIEIGDVIYDSRMGKWGYLNNIYPSGFVAILSIPDLTEEFLYDVLKVKSMYEPVYEYFTTDRAVIKGETYFLMYLTTIDRIRDNEKVDLYDLGMPEYIKVK